MAALSFAHFYIARDVFHVTDNELHSIMYLHISSGKIYISGPPPPFLTTLIAPHFVIFSTRVPGYWYTNIPNWLFTLCIIGTQVIALFFSVYGIFGEEEGVAPCGYPWGLSVLGISLVYFMFLDVVKVHIFRSWSFAMTAKIVPTKSRRNKLATRKELALKHIETQAAWKKLSM